MKVIFFKYKASLIVVLDQCAVHALLVSGENIDFPLGVPETICPWHQCWLKQFEPTFSYGSPLGERLICVLCPFPAVRECDLRSKFLRSVLFLDQILR